MTLRTLMDFERQRWSFSRNRYKKWIFLAVGILWLVSSVLIASKGWFGGQAFKQPVFAWMALYGMLYTAPGLGAIAAVRERKEETVYWWLSLPASREKLLLAKALVALKRWLKLYVTAFVYLVLYIYLLDLANGVWSWSLFVSQMQFGLAEALLSIVIGPFLLMVGLLMGMFRRSDSRFIIALLWMAVITIANLQTSLLGLGFAGKAESFHLIVNLNLTVLFVEGIVAYGLALLIFKFICGQLNRGKV